MSSPRAFLLQTNPCTGVAAVVFSVGLVSPISALEQIESELALAGVSGNVIFDLLLSTGQRLNRYFLAYFDGAQFDLTRFAHEKEQYSTLAPISAKFLHQHLVHLDLSCLPEHKQYAVLHGFAL